MNRLVTGHGEATTFALAFALEELGLPFDLEPIDLHYFAQWTPSHRALSRDGNPVVLEMDGDRMDQPLLALLYLAEIAPEVQLLPDDAADRYAVQALIAQVHHQMADSLSYLGWLATTPESARADYLARLAGRTDRPVLAGWSAVWRDAISEQDRPDHARARSVQGVETIAAMLGDRAWLIADRLTLADIVAFSLVRQARELGLVADDASFTPFLAAWLAKLGARPAAARASARIAAAGLSKTFRPPIFA